GKIPGGKGLRVAVEAEAELVRHIGSEEVKFAESHDVVPYRNRGEERRDVGCRVGEVILLVNVPETDLVLVRHVDVDTVRGGVGVVEGAGTEVNFAQFSGSSRTACGCGTVPCACGGGAGRALKLSQGVGVRRARPGKGRQLSESERGRRADERIGDCAMCGLIFVVGKEKDLVFPDRTADLAAEPVVVKAG